MYAHRLMVSLDRALASSTCETGLTSVCPVTSTHTSNSCDTQVTAVLEFPSASALGDAGVLPSG